ncbi:tRNA (guanosine(46)-N7)-methyltransferase TrmB [Candidatus Saccharibacteria bacterium]|nr:tRNA (guanosine(46)-N7)-methyltransferase TrmB [Candidatus Saccharibacteria bacterium]
MWPHLNPNDFVITRRRKKYKFAKFANAENCFEFVQWQKRHVDVVEIGAGNGLFSVELAARHSELTFVAIDVKADRLQHGAYIALERGLTNVLFVRARADQIDEIFDARSLSRIWLTFPDPFPRQRSAGRRLTHPTFLAKYSALLDDGGQLCLKHDDQHFFAWSLEQFVATHWYIDELSFDLHESDLDDDYKVLTTYEERWLREGKPSQFARARLVARQTPARSVSRDS